MPGSARVSCAGDRIFAIANFCSHCGPLGFTRLSQSPKQIAISLEHDSRRRPSMLMIQMHLVVTHNFDLRNISSFCVQAICSDRRIVIEAQDVATYTTARPHGSDSKRLKDLISATWAAAICVRTRMFYRAFRSVGTP